MHSEERLFDNTGFFGDDYIEIYKNIVKQHEFLINKMVETQLCADTVIKNIKIGSKDYNSLLIMCVFARILSRYEGIMILAQRVIIAECKVLLRSMLESYFILRILCDDDKLIDDFIINDNRRALRIINRTLSNQKYYKENNLTFDYASLENRRRELLQTANDNLFEVPKRQKTVEFILNNSKIFKNLGIKIDYSKLKQEKQRLKQQRKILDFSNAELLAQKAKSRLYYESAYVHFCEEVHFSVRSLEEWLITKDDYVIGVKSRTTVEVWRVLGSNLRLLLESMSIFTMRKK